MRGWRPLPRRNSSRAGVEVTRISLGDFPLPIYDGDLQAKSGVPKHAIDLKRMIGAHHGVLIVTPGIQFLAAAAAQERHRLGHARAGARMRRRGQVFRERAFAIASASAGRFGGARCLAALRLVSTACRATVIPNQLALSFADQAYDDMDRLKHPRRYRGARKRMVRQLIDVAQHMM